MVSDQTKSRANKVDNLKTIINHSLTLLIDRKLKDLNRIDGRNINKVVVEMERFLKQSDPIIPYQSSSQEENTTNNVVDVDNHLEDFE